MPDTQDRDGRSRLPAWLDIRNREQRDTSDASGGRYELETTNHSRATLWAGFTCTLPIAVFCIWRGVKALIAGKLTVSSQMGRVMTSYSWQDDPVFFTALIGITFLAALALLFVAGICLKAIFRSYDR